MGSLRLGLIGAGGIARAHVAATKDLGNVQLTAVADPLAEARNQLAESTGANAFADADELLRQGRDLVDAVIICTPPNTRKGIVRSALEAGVAVMCEKPLAHTSEDAHAIAELAETFDHVVTAVGYCHRFTPAVVEMKRQLEAGELGRAVRFENVFACHFPAMAEKWMSDRAVSGGGSFLDTGCHSLDLCQFLMGKTRVVGSVFSHCWPGRGESNATVLCKAGQGAAQICSGWAEPERFTLSVIGSDASLHYDYAKPEALVRQTIDGKTETLTVQTHEVRFAKQLEAFVNAVRGEDRGVLCTFAEAAAVNAEASRAGELAGCETSPQNGSTNGRIPVMASV